MSESWKEYFERRRRYIEALVTATEAMEIARDALLRAEVATHPTGGTWSADAVGITTNDMKAADRSIGFSEKFDAFKTEAQHLFDEMPRFITVKRSERQGY